MPDRAQRTLPSQARMSRAAKLRAGSALVCGALGMIAYVVALAGLLAGSLANRIFGINPVDLMVVSALLPAFGAIPAQNTWAQSALACGVIWVTCWLWLNASGGPLASSPFVGPALALFYIAPPAAGVLAIVAGSVRLGIVVPRGPAVHERY